MIIVPCVIRLAMDRFVEIALVLVAVVLSGCAAPPDQTPIPMSIQQPPKGNLQLSEALSSPKRYIGAPVRWGGRVITLRKQATGSAEIEILERHLDAQGRPLGTGSGDGRFLIRAAAEVDPYLYQPGNRITVSGTFERLEQRQVGNTEQSLALVQVKEFIHWTDPPPLPAYYDGPYYADSYYRPYYWPHARWPYYHGPRWRFGFGYSN